MTPPDHDAAELLSFHLHQLGPTRDEVAKKLRQWGCRGYLEASTGCPVARYLRRMGWPSALVSADRSVATLGRGASAVEARNPTPVQLFIEDFDAGAFPDLTIGRHRLGAVVAP